METLKQDRETMRIYEQIVLLINHSGEEAVLLGLTENYILRLLEKGNIISRNGKPMKIPELQTNFFSGSVDYGIDTFIEHIKSITSSIVGSEKYFKEKGTNQELSILTALLTFNVAIEQAALEPNKQLRRTKVVRAVFELLSDKKLRATIESMPDPTNQDKHISASPLPTPEEFKGNAFRNVFFNYLHKSEEVVKQKESGEKMYTSRG